MRKNMIIIILTFTIILGFSYLVRNTQKSTSDDKSIAPSYAESYQPLSEDIINCEFQTISSFSFKNSMDTTSDKDRKIYYSTKDEIEPLQITFADLTTDKPKIKGNSGDGQATILNNNEDIVSIAEKNLVGDTFIYTIFKKEKTATLYKAYKLLFTPFGMLSMGYCY